MSDLISLNVKIPLYLGQFYRHFVGENALNATHKSAFSHYLAFLPTKMRVRNVAASVLAKKTAYLAVCVHQSDFDRFMSGENLDVKIGMILHLHFVISLGAYIEGYCAVKKERLVREAIRSFIDQYAMSEASEDALRIAYYRTKGQLRVASH